MLLKQKKCVLRISHASPGVLLPPMLYIISGQTCFSGQLRLLGSLGSEVLIACSDMVG